MVRNADGVRLLPGAMDPDTAEECTSSEDAAREAERTRQEIRMLRRFRRDQMRAEQKHRRVRNSPFAQALARALRGADSPNHTSPWAEPSSRRRSHSVDSTPTPPTTAREASTLRRLIAQNAMDSPNGRWILEKVLPSSPVQWMRCLLDAVKNENATRPWVNVHSREVEPCTGTMRRAALMQYGVHHLEEQGRHGRAMMCHVRVGSLGRNDPGVAWWEEPNEDDDGCGGMGLCGFACAALAPAHRQPVLFVQSVRATHLTAVGDDADGEMAPGGVPFCLDTSSSPTSPACRDAQHRLVARAPPDVCLVMGRALTNMWWSLRRDRQWPLPPDDVMPWERTGRENKNKPVKGRRLQLETEAAVVGRMIHDQCGDPAMGMVVFVPSSEVGGMQRAVRELVVPSRVLHAARMARGAHVVLRLWFVVHTTPPCTSTRTPDNTHKLLSDADAPEGAASVPVPTYEQGTWWVPCWTGLFTVAREGTVRPATCTSWPRDSRTPYVSSVAVAQCVCSQRHARPRVFPGQFAAAEVEDHERRRHVDRVAQLRVDGVNRFCWGHLKFLLAHLLEHVESHQLTVCRVVRLLGVGGSHDRSPQ